MLVLWKAQAVRVPLPLVSDAFRTIFRLSPSEPRRPNRKHVTPNSFRRPSNAASSSRGQVVEATRGYVVHVDADFRNDSIYAFGRLEDGKTFVAADRTWRPRFLVPESQLDTVLSLPSVASQCRVRQDISLRGFCDERLTVLESVRFSNWRSNVSLIESAKCEVWGCDRAIPQLWMRDVGLGTVVSLAGLSRKGRTVDVVFPAPDLRDGGTEWTPSLKWLTIAVEVDPRTNEITSAAWSDPDGSGLLISRTASGLPLGFEGVEPASSHAGDRLRVVVDEKALLREFFSAIRQRDPDVLTGWNIFEVDLVRLHERSAALDITMELGRSNRRIRYRTRRFDASCVLNVPGRQVLDAKRLVRSGREHLVESSIEAAAQAIIHGGDPVRDVRLANLDACLRSFREGSRGFRNSCLGRAELCREVLGATGLMELSVRRSVLTGSLLDTAWTSIASFESFYARSLRASGIVEPPPRPVELSGSAGGTIFEPRATLCEAVMVFDYRSLYPSIMATFCIDPLAHVRAEHLPDAQCVVAPNGARFARGQSILPSFIARCFAERIVAVDRGDDAGAYVLKILMNSLYGILAADGCRYASSEIAGAVTSFGAWCLETARDWFESRSLRVLYGDTDSIFLRSDLRSTDGALTFSQRGNELAREFNRYLSRSILDRWQVESYVQLRFDKAYRQFLIPPSRMQHRSSDAVRGRAKGYAGLEVRPNGDDFLDVKGMEAVRTDVTPLARRLQRQLLTMVFTGGADGIPTYLLNMKMDLLAGRLDDELVYTRKRRQPPQKLENSPFVSHADRATAEVNSERISYVWTVNGPRSIEGGSYKVDYRHYLNNQILPLARGIGVLAGFNPDDILGSGQMELFTS